MITNVYGNIFTFPITLPDNPLKWLNCYVIKSDTGKNLLIDTGFNRPECFAALLAGMKELDLSPEDTDVFLTHLHCDHTGNAFALHELGCNVFMGSLDYHRMIRTQRDNWSGARRRTVEEGMSEEEMTIVFQHNPAVLYSPPPFPVTTVEEGTVLSYGGHDLECIFTPGHTPGHMCLYDKQQKIIFLGDHVLFDITPNICMWADVEDSLGAYLDSLKKIRNYDIEAALPAHRNASGMTMQERIDELLVHHERRLNAAREIINANPGLTAYELAARLKWKIRCDSWDDFPPGQKYFALGETVAHLDYLIRRGQLLRRSDTDGVSHYYPI